MAPGASGAISGFAQRSQTGQGLKLLITPLALQLVSSTGGVRSNNENPEEFTMSLQKRLISCCHFSPK